MKILNHELMVHPRILRSRLEKHGLHPRKELGQNFLIDENFARKIIHALELTEQDTVVEIGAGAGALTQLLAMDAGKVIAIEVDKHIIPLLTEVLGDYPQAQIVKQNVLNVDLANLVAGESSVKVMGNLPYYITSPVLIHVLTSGVPWKKGIFMVQKEFADRLIAVPGTKAYGSLSVFTQYFAKVKRVALLPPTAFFPRPKVASTVISFDFLEQPPIAVNEHVFFAVVRAAFAKRRKTLVNSLVSSLPWPVEKGQIEAALMEIKLPREIRGEQLSLEQFGELSVALEGIVNLSDFNDI